jgi:hypothetical protein
MLTKPALAAWGSGALVTVVVGATVAAQLGATAGPVASPGQASGQAVAAAKADPKDKDEPKATSPADPPSKTLTVTYSVMGKVAPGVPATLALTIQNPNSQAVLLRSVSGTVTSVSAGSNPALPACDQAWFAIGSLTGRSDRINRDQSTTVQVPVTFTNLPINQDNCKNATYSFTFSAAADQA